jgi:hypothetical protein
MIDIRYNKIKVLKQTAKPTVDPWENIDFYQ